MAILVFGDHLVQVFRGDRNTLGRLERGHQEERGKALAAGLLVRAGVGEDQRLFGLAKGSREHAADLGDPAFGGGKRTPPAGSGRLASLFIEETELGGGPGGRERSATSRLRASRSGSSRNGSGRKTPRETPLHKPEDGHEPEAASRKSLRRSHMHAHPGPLLERPARHGRTALSMTERTRSNETGDGNRGEGANLLECLADEQVFGLFDLVRRSDPVAAQGETSLEDH